MTSSIKRVMIFIDGSNFYYSLRCSFSNTKIYFEKFCNFLSENDDLIKIKYYNSPLNIKDNEDEYKKQQRFFAYLSEVPLIDIYFGRLEKRPDGKKAEKGVDVKLAVDLVVNAYKDNYDIAILVSNDADFIPAIQEAKELGKQVINVSFPKTKSYHLNKVCSKTIKVNDISEYLRK
ncbi:MAG: NYN domain-containing protein [archaeon]